MTRLVDLDRFLDAIRRTVATAQHAVADPQAGEIVRNQARAVEEAYHHAARIAVAYSISEEEFSNAKNAETHLQETMDKIERSNNRTVVVLERFFSNLGQIIDALEKRMDRANGDPFQGVKYGCIPKPGSFACPSPDVRDLVGLADICRGECMEHRRCMGVCPAAVPSVEFRDDDDICKLKDSRGQVPASKDWELEPHNIHIALEVKKVREERNAHK